MRPLSVYQELLHARVMITRYSWREPRVPFEQAVLQATIAELRRALETLTTKPDGYRMAAHRQGRIRARLEALGANP